MPYTDSLGSAEDRAGSGYVQEAVASVAIAHEYAIDCSGSISCNTCSNNTCEVVVVIKNTAVANVGVNSGFAIKRICRNDRYCIAELVCKRIEHPSEGHARCARVIKDSGVVLCAGIIIHFANIHFRDRIRNSCSTHINKGVNKAVATDNKAIACTDSTTYYSHVSAPAVHFKTVASSNSKYCSVCVCIVYIKSCWYIVLVHLETCDRAVEPVVGVLFKLVVKVVQNKAVLNAAFPLFTCCWLS